MADETIDNLTTDAPTNTPAPAAPAAVDPVQLTRMFNEALRPLAGTLRAVDSRLQSLEAGVRPQTERQGMQPNDLVPGLDEHITERVRAANEQMLSPLLQPLLDDKIVDMVDRHKTRFESEFGDGSWDKFVKADVDQIIESLPANQRISARHIGLVVDGLKGRYFDQLSEAKGKANKDRADRAAPPPMMGPGRNRASGPTLEPDELDFFDRVAKSTGKRIDPKEWVVERELGNTAAEWREYFKSKQEKKH